MKGRGGPRHQEGEGSRERSYWGFRIELEGLEKVQTGKEKKAP